MRHFRSRWLVLVVVALLAVSCGDDSSDDATTDDAPSETTAESTADDDSDEAPADDGTDEPADDDAPSDAPVELTATDTGVTATTIKIGAVFPDLTVFGRDNGDVEAKFQVAVDAVNDAGGVGGRDLELVFSLYQPIGDTEAEALCVRMTQDEEVFAVVGLFLRSTVLCYTEFEDTIAVTTFPPTAEQFERSVAPLISVDAIPDRLVGENVDALLAAGHLEEGLKVAVHGLAGEEDLRDAYVEVLKDRGVDVVSTTLRTVLDDVNLATEEVALIAERWVADDAEAVLGTSGESATDFAGAYEAAGLELPMLLPEGSSTPPSLIQDSLGFDVGGFEFAVALIRGLDDAALYENDVAGAAGCIDRFEAVSGEAVNLDPTGDGPTNSAPTIMACQAIDIFAAVAEAAGADLTTESFAAAAEGFGSIDVTGVAEGSLGPGKFDVTDTPPSIARFDAEILEFVVVED